jgi:uncharacterized membrane protein YeaQ/YmgE (transglycosylase-associated protein family)
VHAAITEAAVSRRTIIASCVVSRQSASNLQLPRPFVLHAITKGRETAISPFFFGGIAVITSFIGWVVFGLIAGAIARLLMPGRQPMGIVLTIILGIIGSFVGGVIGNAFHGDPFAEPTASGWIGSIVGALLVLIIYGMVANRRTTV